MDDQIQLGFQLANELSKQLLTLSTGILALSVTFTKDLLKGDPGVGLGSLKAAWACLLATILFAVAHMHALTGHLLPVEYRAADSIGGFARLLGAGELLAFLAAIAFLLRYGVLSAASIGEEDGSPVKAVKKRESDAS